MRDKQTFDYSVVDYGFEDPIITPVRPFNTLPWKEIHPSHYRLLPSLDTVRMGAILDSIPGRNVFTFISGPLDHHQAIAIRREKDWLLIDSKVFSLGASAFKKTLVDIDGTGSDELVLAYEQLDDTQSHWSIFGEKIKKDGTKILTRSTWTKSKRLSIIDIDKVAFLVDNITTGYEYFYETAKKFTEQRQVNGVETTVHGSVNTYRATFNVWYTFDIFPKEKSIMITLETCNVTTTLDKGKHYYSTSFESDERNPEVEMTVPSCTPIFEPGLYKLEDGRFLHVQ